jgi:tubulin-specific chaperone D
LEDPKSNFANDVLTHTKAEMTDNKNLYKFLDCISVLCQILQVGGDVCHKSLRKLVIYLCAMKKYIRKSTASKLYDSLLIYGDVMSIETENMDQVCNRCNFKLRNIDFWFVVFRL